MCVPEGDYLTNQIQSKANIKTIYLPQESKCIISTKTYIYPSDKYLYQCDECDLDHNLSYLHIILEWREFITTLYFLD